MLMPETAVYEDRQPGDRKDDVRLAGEALGGQPIAQPLGK